jgi:hypothetical protein
MRITSISDTEQEIIGEGKSLAQHIIEITEYDSRSSPHPTEPTPPSLDNDLGRGEGKDRT